MKKHWIVVIAAITALLILLSVLAGCGKKDSASTTSAVPAKEKVVVNIGYQQGLSALLIAKQKGWFEEAFAKVGAEVKWNEFQSGPPYFEAISANRLDFGAVGDTPVIAGQAGNVDFKEIALASHGLKGDAIVVPAESPIKSLKDLKGKKVAVAKGSAAFNFLYRAIDYAGLKPEDVNIIQLQPNEAQPAFESGAVDAWSIWEPFITIEQIQRSAKVLASGETIQAPDPGFVIARTKMLKDHPELAVVFLQVFNQSIQWEKEHQEESIDFFAALKKLDKKIVKQVVENDESTIEPITDQIVQNQQKTADFLYSLGGIKQKIDVSKVVDNSFVEKALKNENI